MTNENEIIHLHDVLFCSLFQNCAHFFVSMMMFQILKKGMNAIIRSKTIGLSLSQSKSIVDLVTDALVFSRLQLLGRLCHHFGGTAASPMAVLLLPPKQLFRRLRHLHRIRHRIRNRHPARWSSSTCRDSHSSAVWFPGIRIRCHSSSTKSTTIGTKAGKNSGTFIARACRFSLGNRLTAKVSSGSGRSIVQYITVHV